MMLIVRDGVPLLKTPEHVDGGEVPDDFLVLIGIAASFLDPNFRATMQRLVREAQEEGRLDAIMSKHDDRPN